MSLKEKIQGNELDLSLNQLTEVPVKELAAATKVSQLDLSSNRIQTLPREFSTLTHLVKIDLSNNRLTELPENFGNLYNLQYLDLYANRIQALPLSFSRLKNLHWLDLKNNPLEPQLKSVAGDCLDEKQCRACAKKVVAFMHEIDSNVERVRQKLLKIEREKEAAQKAKIEKELEEQRRLKKLERERRKAESKARREAELNLEREQQADQEESERFSEDGEMEESSASSSGGNNFKLIIFIMLIVALFVPFIYLILFEPVDSYSLDTLTVLAQKYAANMKSNIKKVIELMFYYIPIIREYLLRILHYYMVTVTHTATQIEHIISLYFQ